VTEPLILPLAPGDPQRLGRHQLIGLLGHGGMGRVYLGVAPDGRQVAVKVMHPQFAGDTAFRARFKREAETAQRVSGPFTARVLDSGAGPAARPHGAPGLGDVPPGLRALIARCLRPDPGQRATLAEITGECGHPGIPRLGDWLPQPAAAFVRTRAQQQQSSVTTLLNGSPASPSQQAGRAAPPRPAGAVPPRQRYRALSARIAAASERWPLVRPASLRRWSRLALLLSLLAFAEVASRTAVAERGGPAQLPWLAPVRNIQATIRQFTSWLPDPMAAWSPAAGAPAGMAARLAVAACALVTLTAIARRTRRAGAHQVAIKAVATYAADVLALLMTLWLVQTGFAPLIHIAEYLRWWAVAVLAVSAAVVYPLAGPAR